MLGAILCLKATAVLALDQFEFMKIVILTREEYRRAENDFKKAPLRAERKKALCNLVGDDHSVVGWIGKLYELRATRDPDGKGNGIIVVDLGREIYLETSRGFWDFNSTLVTPDKPLYQKLGTLVEGQDITFSGNFIIGNSHDCIEEASATESGSMTQPEFEFNFIDISPFKSKN